MTRARSWTHCKIVHILAWKTIKRQTRSRRILSLLVETCQNRKLRAFKHWPIRQICQLSPQLKANSMWNEGATIFWISSPLNRNLMAQYALTDPTANQSPHRIENNLWKFQDERLTHAQSVITRPSLAHLYTREDRGFVTAREEAAIATVQLALRPKNNKSCLTRRTSLTSSNWSLSRRSFNKSSWTTSITNLRSPHKSITTAGSNTAWLEKSQRNKI